MKEIDEDLIYNQFEGYSLEMMKKIFSKLTKRKEKDEKKQSKVREDKFNKAVKELFDLCPQVTMIPIGKTLQYQADCYETNDFEEVQDIAYDYFGDEAIPKEYDDITIGNYNKMMKLWEVACENSPIVYQEFDGDYCSMCHVTMYYFDRERQEVIETKEV